MPTFLEQFSDAEIKVRYKEPLLTAALDQMLTGITPQGIHRGFRLATSAAVLKVTVQADPADNDHIAAYTTADGYTLRLRRTGGDFDLDLSAFTNKEVVIAIFAEYATAVTTAAEIRAYEYDPVDEFTGAAERGELVVLGKVTVPASGVIPANDIDPTFRTLAWDHVGSDAMPWEQVVENGSFELAADDAVFTAADRGFVPHWDTQYIPSQHTWEITAVSPHTGNYALKVTGSGVASLSIVPPDRIVAVQPGQLIRVSYWMRGETWSGVHASGTMGLQLNFFGPNLSLVAFRTVQDKTLSGTFGWTEFDEYIEVPSGVAWLVPAITIYDLTTPATGSLVFDDIRIWMSKGPPTIPYSSVQDGLTNGGHIVGQLGIAETNVSQFGITQDLETFVKGILSLHKSDNVAPSLNRYQWGRLDEEPWAIRLIEGALHLEGLDGSADEASIARFKTKFPIHTTVSAFTLIHHMVGPLTADQIRLYVSSGTMTPTGTVVPALCYTFNCYWDEATLRWIADSPGATAAMHIFNEQGASGHYQMEPANTVAPWTQAAWTNGTALVGWEAPLSSLLTVDAHSNDFRLTIDNPSTFTNPTTGSTPPANSLMAKNIIKAWGRLYVASAVPSVGDAFNVNTGSIAVTVAGRLEIPYRTPMTASIYAVLATSHYALYDWGVYTMNSLQVTLEMFDRATGARQDLNSIDGSVSLLVMAEQ